AQIEQALHANLLYRLRADGSQSSFVVVDREPSIDFDVPVLWITGLTDYLLPRPAAACVNCQTKGAPGQVLNGTGAGATPAGNLLYLASDLRAAYLGAPPSPCASLDGTGETIGILALEGFNPQDIAAYAMNNPPSNAFNVGVVYGNNDGQTGRGETTADIEMVMGVAPGAQIRVFESDIDHTDDVLFAM